MLDCTAWFFSVIMPSAGNANRTTNKEKWILLTDTTVVAPLFRSYRKIGQNLDIFLLYLLLKELQTPLTATTQTHTQQCYLKEFIITLCLIFSIPWRGRLPIETRYHELNLFLLSKVCYRSVNLAIKCRFFNHIGA